MRALGHRPDPEDPRDFSASEAFGAAPVPERSDNSRLYPSVLDQSYFSSCVANMGMQLIRAAMIRQGAVNPELGSRLWGYRWARVSHHEGDRDAGTFPRSFFSVLNKIGFPPESAFPYDTDPANAAWRKTPPLSAFRRARDQKAPTIYRRILETGHARIPVIKRALGAGYGVGFGTAISTLFADNVGTDGVIDPPTNILIAGNHAMGIVDHDHDVFRAVNSWGEDFADGGFVRLSADYLAWSRTVDLWIVEKTVVFPEAA